MIELFIPYDPQPRKEPLWGQARMRTHPKTRRSQNEMRILLRAEYKGEPLDGPLQLYITFVIEKPKSTQREHPHCRPDLSNYLKNFEDAANGILWRDDAQLVRMYLSKRYSVDPLALDLIGIYIRLEKITPTP